MGDGNVDAALAELSSLKNEDEGKLEGEGKGEEKRKYVGFLRGLGSWENAL